MDDFLKRVYVTEVKSQGYFAYNAIDSLNQALRAVHEFDGDWVRRNFFHAEVFRQPHSFLTHASNISRLFWPPQPRKRKDETPEAFVQRQAFTTNTVWLTQEQMCAVFGVQKAAISKHLKNIYQDGELEPNATVSILETVRSEGLRQVKRQIEHYNLDAIISVGYRVNSRSAVQFRQWATRILREHLSQGWTLNRQRFEAKLTWQESTGKEQSESHWVSM